MTQPSDTPKTSGGSRSPVAAHPVISAVIAILIFASIFFSLYVPLYARATPMVGDFPFFYFYLLALHAGGGRRARDRPVVAAAGCGPERTPSGPAGAGAGEVTR